MSPDGATVFVTGSSYPDYATLAYDAGSGTQLRVVTAARGDATTLGVSPLGTAEFVSGFFGTPTDFGTFAYDLVP